MNKIKSSNVKAGLAINPDTNWEVVIPFLDKLDIIVVMSVHPGFGGQKFISSALEKLKLLRKKINETHPHIELEIDGGVNFENIDSISYNFRGFHGLWLGNYEENSQITFFVPNKEKSFTFDEMTDIFI